MDQRKAIRLSLLLIVICSPVYGQFEEIFSAEEGLWQTSTVWGDFDNDKDYDFIVAGYLPEKKCKTWLFENVGGSFVRKDIPLTGLQRASVDVGDLDNDGLLDFVVCGQNDDHVPVTLIYMNNGRFDFAERNELIGVFDGSVKLADFNNDGKLDIGLAGEVQSGVFIAKIFENENGIFTDTQIELPGIRLGTLEWADYNNDGYIDITVTGEDMNFNFPTNLYQNNGDNGFSLVEAPFTGLMFTGNAWGDYDDDGDLDMVVSGETMDAKFFTHVFRNDMTGFSKVQGNFSNTMNGTVQWGDYDNNGSLDLLATGVSGSNVFSTVLYENNNSLDKVITELPGVAIRSTGLWADVDNDFDLDLLLSGADPDLKGIIKVFENGVERKNNRPLPPQNLTHFVQGSTLRLEWDSGQDLENKNLSYNVFLRNITTGETIVSSDSHNDGFRKVQRFGNTGMSYFKIVKGLVEGEYEWSVQSIDNSFIGSEFAAKQMFRVDKIVSVDVPSYLDIQVSPNPFTDQLHLQQGSLKAYSFSLTDLNGRIVLKRELVGENQIIETNSLSPGAYLLTLTKGDHSIRRKLLKM